MDYYSETQQQPQSDPYAPPAKKQRSDDLPREDEVVVIKEKIMIPTERYPGYNFVGSIIGPSGSILKELQKTLNARIAVFGKGSMRKDKEAELLNSDDEKYAHLKEPLHVLIDIKAPRSAAHLRMHHALVEMYKFMTPPDQNGHGQFEQGHYGVGGGYENGYDNGYEGGYDGPPRGRGGPRGAPRGGPPRGAPRGAPRGGSRGAPRGGPPRGGMRGRGGRGAPRGGGGY